MKCLLLTAGFGNRLRPLTVFQAKPTLPLAGRPLLQHTLEWLGAAGVEEVFMNLHHRPDSVRETVESYLPSGMEVTFSEEKEILGTGGAIRALQSLLSSEEDFLLVNGDCYFGFPLRPIIEAHHARRGLATMALRPVPSQESYGLVGVSDQGRVVQIAGRPFQPVGSVDYERMFIGIHVISSDIWRFMPNEANFDINRDVYPMGLDSGQEIWSWEARGSWHDIGTPRRYLGANLDILHAGGSDRAARDWPDVRQDGPVLAGDDVEVGSGTILSGGVVLGDGVKVGASCMISRSVVMDGCHIGDRCTVTDAIIGVGSRISDNEDLTECVVVPYEEGAKLRRRELVGANVVARFDTYERG